MSEPSQPDDLYVLEQRKMLELFESVALLLTSDLVQWMDKETHAQLLQLREVVQAWVQGNSTLSHEELLTTIAALTASLGRGKTILLDEGSKSLH